MRAGRMRQNDLYTEEEEEDEEDEDIQMDR